MRKTNPFVSQRLSTNLTDYVLSRKIVDVFGTKVELNAYKQDCDFHQIGFSPKLIDLIAQNKFTDGEMKILLYLLSKVKRNKGTVTLVVRKISAVFGYSEQKVRDAINKFKHLKLIQRKSGRGNASTYDINPHLVFNGHRIQYLEDLGFRGLHCVDVNITYL